MKITATTQPQAIYPFGEQHALVVTNVGPGTIWLGSDSSVSTDQSMPVPPLASVPWGAGIALWVVSDSQANVRIDHAIAAPVTSGEGKQNVIAPVSFDGGVTSYYNVGSYDSVQITMTLGENEFSTAFFFITLLWAVRQSDGTFITLTDERVTTTGSLFVGDTYVSRKVRGEYLSVSVARIIAGNAIDQPLVDTQVLASTIPLAERTSYTRSEGASFISTAISSNHGKQFLEYSIPSTENGFVILGNEGKYLQLSVQFLSATTTATNLQVALRGDNTLVESAIFFSQTLPVGSTNVKTDLIAVPIGSIYGVRLSANWGAGIVARVTAVWTND